MSGFVVYSLSLIRTMLTDWLSLFYAKFCLIIRVNFCAEWDVNHQSLKDFVVLRPTQNRSNSISETEFGPARVPVL